MDWQVGDLAVCVKTPNVRPGRKVTGDFPTVGTTYRVIGVRTYLCPDLYLELESAPDCLEGDRNWGPLWVSTSFRKADKHETSNECEQLLSLLKGKRSPAQHEHIMDGLGDD